MKNQLSDSADIAPRLFTRVHLLTAIAGIVIAIVCGLVVLRDHSSVQQVSKEAGKLHNAQAAISQHVITVTRFSMTWSLLDLRQKYESKYSPQ